jgi:hypothetical protein
MKKLENQSLVCFTLIRCRFGYCIVCVDWTGLDFHVGCWVDLEKLLSEPHVYLYYLGLIVDLLLEIEGVRQLHF